MTKNEFIKVLIEKIEQYEIDQFFKLLSNSIDTSKYDISSLKEEWDKTKQTERLGLFNQSQSIAAFKSFFHRYAKNSFEQLSDKEIKSIDTSKKESKEPSGPIEKNVESDYKTTPKEERQYIESENTEVENNIGKRPVIISILCVLGVISILYNLFNLTKLSELNIQISAFLIFVTIFQFILHGIHIVGLWKMKKWNILVYGINFIIGLIIELSGTISFTGAIKYMTLFIVLRIIGLLFYWTVLGVYYKRMT